MILGSIFRNHLDGAASARYRNYVLGMLTLAYTLNFVDRILIGVVAQPIIEEFRLKDWQFGLLSGFGFAIMYTAAGIPVARLAERANRVWIIGLSVIVWSAMTALCGLAGSFLTLLVFRVGVGIGEAGCTPAAHSLISNYFPKGERTRAFAVYATGVTIGGILANLFGGPITQAFTWREAFMILGLPGILVGMVMLLTLREPKRPVADDPTAGAPRNIFKAMRSISSPAYWTNIAAATLASFFAYSLSNFQAPFFQRVHGLTVAEVATSVSVPASIAGAIGTLSAGFLIDRVSGRFPRSIAQLPGAALMLAVPLYLTVFLTDDRSLAVALIIMASFLFHSYFGASFAICQTVVDDYSRATAVAVMLFVVNLLGYGLGPLCVGLVSDLIAQSHIINHLASAGAALDCRQVLALKTAAAQSDLQACRAASASGLRGALIAGLACVFLAGLAFLRCSRLIRT